MVHINMVAVSGDDDGFVIPSSQKKKNRRNNNHNHRNAPKSNRTSKPFGSASWSKPKKNTKQQTRPSTAVASNDKETQSHTVDKSAEHYDDDAIDETAAWLGDLVASELQESETLGLDPTSAAIASTAAVTMFLNAYQGSLVQQHVNDDNEPKDGDNNDETTNNLSKVEHDMSQDVTPEVLDFQSQAQKQTLSSLLADYGEQDINWMQNTSANITSTDPETNDEPLNTVQEETVTSSTPTESRLGQHGKAPIHIEFISFGYHNGAPPVRNKGGWTHSQPLLPFDVRDIGLPQVPHYLAWQDGMSGAVKRALIRPPYHPQQKDDNNESLSITKYARDTVAKDVASAVMEAINEGGHGYAMPLKMSIFIGSDQGRHRSVVIAELAATEMRKLLRNNRDNEFKQPCSVGTRHRDVARNQSGNAARNKGPRSKKQSELEDDW